jgi:hypothetical protein
MANVQLKEDYQKSLRITTMRYNRDQRCEVESTSALIHQWDNKKLDPVRKLMRMGKGLSMFDKFHDRIKASLV